MNREEYLTERNKYFKSHAWKFKTCPKCHSSYFTKRGLDTCGSYSCENGYSFLGLGSRRRFIELMECYNSSIDFFQSEGYELARPIETVRRKERTLFASAAGQVFDDAIYKGRSVSSPDVVCAQPVIRLQLEPWVGKREGYSTSFLNLATDRWNSPPDAHFEALDSWLTYLSRQGLYAGNICLKAGYEDNDWEIGHVHSETLRFNYGGLELGIANFFLDIPRVVGGTVAMSDISFGLERLVWGINKSGSYFDGIGPLIYILYNPDKITLMDSIRTMSLMAASGVSPAHRGHGSKFRLLAKKTARTFGLAPYRELSDYYHYQWSQFIKAKNSSDMCAEIILEEIERNVTLSLSAALGFKDSRKIDRYEPEGYLHSLLKRGDVRLSELREKIRRIRGEGLLS